MISPEQIQQRHILYSYYSLDWQLSFSEKVNHNLGSDEMRVFYC